MKRFVIVVSSLILALGASTPSLAQHRVPDGSYRTSCQDTRVEGDMLKALCERRDKKLVPAELKLPCYGSVANSDGKLVCAEDPRKIPPPRGSYLMFCTNISN
ncbi:MAG: CVNH domain-containing protein, partial [Polyangiaceae bacterium]